MSASASILCAASPVGEHVFFVDHDGQFRRLYFDAQGGQPTSGRWVELPFDPKQPHPLGVPGAGISLFFGGPSALRVFYESVESYGLSIGRMDFDAFNWGYEDLRREAGTAFVPAASTPIASYMTGSGASLTERVFYIGADRNLWLLSNLNAKWVDSCIAKNIARADSGLTGFADSVFYISLDQTVHLTYLDGPLWRDDDITVDSRGPHVGATDITSFADHDGSHVFYVAVDGCIHELSSNGAPPWKDANLTSATGGQGAGVSAHLASFGSDVGKHVFYVALDDHIHELFFNGGEWVDVDLAQEANGPVARRATALSSVRDAFGFHVVYAADDGCIHQLYSGDALTSWVDQNLTEMTQGSAPFLPLPPPDEVGLVFNWDSQHLNRVGQTYSAGQIMGVDNLTGYAIALSYVDPKDPTKTLRGANMNNGTSATDFNTYAAAAHWVARVIPSDGDGPSGTLSKVIVHYV